MSVNRHRRGLIRRRAIFLCAERGDRACINDALDSRRHGRFHQRMRTVDIDAMHRRWIGHPDAVIGGDMKKRLAIFQRLAIGFRLAEIAFDDFNIEPRKIAPVVVRSRASARNRCPFASSTRATAAPTNPVAPVMKLIGVSGGNYASVRLLKVVYISMRQAVKIFHNPFAAILQRKHRPDRNFSRAAGNIEDQGRLAKAG